MEATYKKRCTIALFYIDSTYASMFETESNTKIIYEKSLINEKLLYNKFTDIQSKFSLNIDNDDFMKSFSTLYTITKISMYHSFQFRFLHNVIMLNDRLVHYGIVDTNKCTWCKMEKETLDHFFWSCINIERYWSLVQQLILQYTKGNIQLSFENVFLLNLDCLSNLITLVTKQALYKWHCLGAVINIDEVDFEIQVIKEVELKEATGSGKIWKFNKK